MLKEYETKFVIGEIVKFFVGDDPYAGEIEEILEDKYQRNHFKYVIFSGGHNFIRFENEIEPYETEIDENYICDDCLLSNILDDVEEGSITANEAREVLGLEMIELEEVSVRNISAGNMVLTEDGKTSFPLDTGSFRISTEDGSWTWIENEAELNEYAEYKTAGNAYFSIFPDDEHDDAVHIEIDPTWLWTNDDIDELIEQLNLAKIGNSNNDYRVEEVVDYDLKESTAVSLFKFEDGVMKLNYNKSSNSEKEIFVVKTPYYYSEEEQKNLKEYIEKPFNNAGRNVEILILPDSIKISDI